MAPRRINVKALRSRLGMSQGDVARHIWGPEIKGTELRDRKRTVRKWEANDRTPGPIFMKHLKELQSMKPSDVGTPMRRSVAPSSKVPSPFGGKFGIDGADGGGDDPRHAMPRRKPIGGGILPGLGGDE